METDTKFHLGERVAFYNIGFVSTGVISNVTPAGTYEVKWDDGFVDEADYYYDEDELVAADEADYSGTYTNNPWGVDEDD